MARRRKSGKISVSGIAALMAVGLLLGNSGGNQPPAPIATPTPAIVVTATPTASVVPIYTPTERPVVTPSPTPRPTITPTKRPDPTAAPDNLVWVSQSGSRYHCVADCSNMQDPLVMTEDEAIAKGRKPCGSCYK